MNTSYRILTLAMLMLLARPAFAGWIANADFTSCPRKYFPNTHGEEGPFASQSACQARVDQAKREQQTVCAKYTCVDKAAGTSNSASTGGGALDGHISNAISAGMSGQISGTDAMGLVGMGLVGNALIGGASRQQTPQEMAAQAEQNRILAEHQARANEAARVKEAAYQDHQDSITMALLDTAAADFQRSPATPDPKDQPVSTVYSKGYEHASSCISANAGTACAGVTAAEQQRCVSDYNAGFSNGRKKQTLDMDEAYKIGKTAGAIGELANGPANPAAAGPCRTDWIQQYNRGYFSGKNAK